MAQLSLMTVMAYTTIVEVAAVSSFFHRKETICACRNWKQTYQNGDVTCGAGQEWAWEATNTSDLPYVYELHSDKSLEQKGLMCKGFWKVLDTERCVNMNVGKDEGTWCYVDSACKDLNGGSGVDDKLSWKKCAAEDLKLRDYTPEELYNFSKQQDIGFASLQRMSYPGSKAGERQLVSEEDFSNEIPLWVTLKIKEFGHSTTPYWFDTNKNGTRPIMIVYGTKVYKVVSGPNKDILHPSSWTALNCTLGC